MALAGRVIEGGVRLIRPVGRGSHSVAYLAVTPLGQPCTVKLFRPEMLEHAQREYRLGSQFRHPHMTRVVLISRLDDYPILVMSWVQGETLFTRYRQRPALRHEPAAFLRTMRGVVSALGYMHRLGVLHRDVKPDNILVRPDGEATLVDYDLSGALSDAAPTQVGTPAFQSPEAQQGAELSEMSDLYGVGLLLYWGCVGQLPEDARGGEPGPVLGVGTEPEADAAGGLLPQVMSLAEHLLQPDPQDRLASAAAVEALLEHWLTALAQPEPGSGGPGTAPDNLRQPGA